MNTNTASAQVSQGDMNKTAPNSLFPILSIGLLFFIFGFVTWLNGALIPFLQMVCQLSEIEALFIAFCFYVAYVVMALPMAKILEHTGYQKGMSLGLVMIAVGSLLFVPAALTQTFGVFLLAQFVVGSGLTILQTASNPFIVRLGSQDSAAARIAFMGLLNKGAGVVAPIVFTALVLGDFAGVSQVSLAQMDDMARAQQIDEMAIKLIQPYVGMAIALVLLAVVFVKIPLPEIDFESSDTANNEQQETGSIWQFPHLILGAITLFFYVGVEVVAGDTIGLYGSALGVENATSLTSFTMAAMVLGYVLGLLLIPRYISQSRALLGSALLGIGFSVAIVFGSNDSMVLSQLLWGWLGLPAIPDTVTCIALLGLANAMVWPAIWPLALDGLGKWTPQGSAILIMGIAGGAVFPLLYGVLAQSLGAGDAHAAGDVSGSQTAYLMLVPCYGFIAYYALLGHKKRSW